jgi:hypothetical protein
MKPLNITRSRIKLFTVILIVFFGYEQGYCLTSEEIFNWVAHELSIQNTYEMPVVLFVDKETLADAFRQGNKKAYRLWQAKYGSAQAEQIMLQYLNDVIGLFEPKSQTIFIGDFLSDCRAQAVTAHEFVHFFQNITHPFGDEKQYAEESMHLFRELQAHSIEYRFMELFCETGDIP